MSILMENWETKELEESYKGAVLETRERNGYNDSDFYATVWDEESQSIKTIEYATTRGYCGRNDAFADATDTNQEKARKYLEGVWFKMLKNEYQAKSNIIGVDKEVEVIAGKKVAHGTKGTVFWMREKNFNGHHVTAIGIRDEANAVHWTYAHNVKVVNPEQYVPADEEIVSKVKGKKFGWTRHLTPPGFIYV